MRSKSSRTGKKSAGGDAIPQLGETLVPSDVLTARGTPEGTPAQLKVREQKSRPPPKTPEIRAQPQASEVQTLLSVSRTLQTSLDQAVRERDAIEDRAREQSAVIVRLRQEMDELAAQLGQGQPGATLRERARQLRQEHSALQAKSADIARMTRRVPAPIRRLLQWCFFPSRHSREVIERAELVRGSGLFDADHYRKLAGSACATDLDPAIHYVLKGELLGLAPSPDFDPVYYAERYPDVASSGAGLLLHYVLHGRREGRRPMPLAKEFVADPARFSPDKDTIVLVSHEASRTGAPILALNVGQRLSVNHNVITVLLRDGALAESFDDISAQLICLEERHRHPVELRYLVEWLLLKHEARYTVINSIASYAIVPVLAGALIPTITLVHEFSSHAGPVSSVRDALTWTTELVFSTDIAADSFRKEHPTLLKKPVHILAQGPCELPLLADEAEREAERELLETAMRPAGAEDALVVLGAGFVHIRKGVDLFLATAAAALRLNPKCNVRFVWIGQGYDPEVDPHYSVYLAEQIERSGLEDHVILLDQITDFQAAYSLADVFYLSSRIDPLPNVTIDAAMRGLPIVCFEGATGMADVLRRDETASKTVVPYLDAETAARRIVELEADAEFLQRVGQATRRVAEEAFDMERYISSIEEIASRAVDAISQRRADLETLSDDPLFNAELALSDEARRMTREAAILCFLTIWAASRTSGRPFPGFHPQIYAQHHPKIFDMHINPLADFIRQGEPSGPWLHRVIRPDLVDRVMAPREARLRTAIQAHFHYPELIDDFLDRLSINSSPCDLLLSTNDEAKAAVLRAATARFRQGRVEVRIIPNRGRDIAPLLTAYASEIAENYDVVGHLHAKRSVDVDSALGERWREFLWQHLLGDRHPMMDIALSHFADEAKLGLIFPEDRHLCGWDDNFEIAEDLAARAKIAGPLPEFFNFPIGTMFWARPQALAPLLDLKLDWDDYPEEPITTDGTTLHALERLLPFAAQEQGYTYATVHIPGITR